MMIAKEGVLDRIEQSFSLLKENFLAFFLPLFLYQLFTVVLFGILIISVVMVTILGVLNASVDFFSFLNSPTMVLLIAIGMVLFILYLLLYIPFFLGLLKSLVQAYKGEEVTPKENVVYGFSKLFSSLKTYWYIFAYIALLPSLIFIVSGLLFIGAFYDYGNPDILKGLGIFGMVIASILFLIFSIYRGTRASFALYNAVEKDEYNLENFTHSLSVTRDKWWRIFGNFLLVGLIIGFVISFITNFISAFGSGGLLGVLDAIDPESPFLIEDMKEAFSGYIENYSLSGSVLSSIFTQILTLTGTIFMIIFTYLFFRRLDDEYNPTDTVEIMTEESINERLK